MGAQSSCSLVVLHYTVIVEDFSTAFTVAEIKQTIFMLFQIDERLHLYPFRTVWESVHIDLKKKKKHIHDNNITLSISFTWKQAEDQRWGTADEDKALHFLACLTLPVCLPAWLPVCLPAWLTCSLGGFLPVRENVESGWGGCGSTPQIPLWSGFRFKCLWWGLETH